MYDQVMSSMMDSSVTNKDVGPGTKMLLYEEASHAAEKEPIDTELINTVNDTIRNSP